MGTPQRQEIEVHRFSSLLFNNVAKQPLILSFRYAVLRQSLQKWQPYSQGDRPVLPNTPALMAHSRRIIEAHQQVNSNAHHLNGPPIFISAYDYLTLHRHKPLGSFNILKYLLFTAEHTKMLKSLPLGDRSLD